MFFGVGGTGKSWLLKRFRHWLAEGSEDSLGHVDFDRKSGGPSYVSDFSTLLAEVWRQLDVECPRFETAYAWMRFKQGAGDRPLVRHSGKVSAGWEFVKEGGQRGLSVGCQDVNLLVWAGGQAGEGRPSSKLEKTSVGQLY